MKNFLLICLLWIPLSVLSDEIPAEWNEFTVGGYIYDVQSDVNINSSETELKNNLLNIARTNLAKQIQVSVKDVASLDKNMLNGRTSVSYSSSTQFSTNVNLKLVETKTYYNAATKTGYAIAYINKERARNYYSNELQLVYNKIQTSIQVTNNFISTGFKYKAKQEIQRAQPLVKKTDEPLLWLNVYGISNAELQAWQNKVNSARQEIEQLIADLNHATCIYLSCSADIFGKSYSKLANEIKGILSAEGCSFTTNKAEADWVITVTSTAREYNRLNMGNSSSYFSYVDTSITIDKVKTSQRIYEDEISVKGGHTISFQEAAQAAMKDTKKQIGTILIQTIKQ